MGVKCLSSLTSKIRFNVLMEGGGEFMRNIAVNINLQ